MKYIKNRWLQNFDEIWCIIFQLYQIKLIKSYSYFNQKIF